MPTETIHYWHHPALPEIELSQASFQHFSFDKHVHLDFHLGAVIQGAQQFVNRGVSYTLAKYDLSTLNPDMAHDGHSICCDGYQVKVMAIPQAYVQQIATELGIKEAVFLAPMVNDSQLHQWTVALHDMLIKGHCSQLAAESLMMTLVQQLLVRYVKNTVTLDTHCKGLSRAQVDLIKQRFHAEPWQNMQLASLAAELDLSKFQFLRQFKLATGMAPHAYFKRVRLEYAKKSLRQGDRVVNVAQQLGFFDQSHLNKAFKQAFLLSPIQFQRHMS